MYVFLVCGGRAKYFSLWRAEFFTSDLIGARELADSLCCACMSARAVHHVCVRENLYGDTYHTSKIVFWPSRASVGRGFFFGVPSEVPVRIT